MLIRRTNRGPLTASFQMAVRTVLPSHATSRGRPTLSDRSRPFIAPHMLTRSRPRRERVSPPRQPVPERAARRAPVRVERAPRPGLLARRAGEDPGDVDEALVAARRA